MGYLVFLAEVKKTPSLLQFFLFIGYYVIRTVGFTDKGGVSLSPGMLKMWISMVGMGFMILAIASIYFSRFKLKGFFRIITAMFAYLFVILSGLTLFIVFFT